MRWSMHSSSRVPHRPRLSAQAPQFSSFPAEGSSLKAGNGRVLTVRQDVQTQVTVCPFGFVHQYNARDAQ